MRHETSRTITRDLSLPRLFRRVLWGLATGLFAVAPLATPWAAEAQDYQATMHPAPYETLPLPGGGPVTTYGDREFQGWGYTPPHVDIQLPFPVGFFGDAYTELRVLGQGAITFDMNVFRWITVREMRPIPDPSGFHNFIAAWWDQIVCNNLSAGPLRTQVIGNAPNRQFVIEWERCRRYAASGYPEATFQIRLNENGDEVEIHYGDIMPAWSSNWAGTIGVENFDGSGGTMALAHCAPVCDHNEFPTDHVVRFTATTPALLVQGIQGEVKGHAGSTFPLRFTLSNPGLAPAENFTVAYWLNSEPEITPQALSLGHDERSWSLDPDQRVAV